MWAKTGLGGGRMNCIKDGKYTGDSCFGCKVYAVECEIRDKVYRNRWIPVSERLPEKRGVYLATFLEEGKRYVERFYYSDFTGWMMPIAWQDEGRIENILAWQPLPEPYKEENHD